MGIIPRMENKAVPPVISGNGFVGINQSGQQSDCRLF
jgi:hypothetical protein